MKKKILVLALIVICLSIMAYGTAAYFTYEQTATNVITAGNIRLQLEQWSVDADGAVLPSGEAGPIVPGMDLGKCAQVRNVGGHAAWVRFSAAKAIELATGVEGEVDLGLVSLELNTEHWTERDGYYYYNHLLQPGQVTEPIFLTVTFSAQMQDLYENSTAYITMTAYAVQAMHNGETVFEAQGWPVAE